jgi:hypothetical protein
MFDGNFASRAIYKTLADDATLTALHNGIVEDIWGRDEEVPTEAFPFIAFSIMDAEDQYYNGHARAVTNQPVMIRAIQRFESSPSYGGTLEAIADRIDTLLHGQTVTVYDTDNTTVLGCAYISRVSPLRQRFIDGSIEYRYLGGIYNVSTNEH